MTKKDSRSETVRMIKKEFKIDTAKITEEDKAKGITSVADVKLEKVTEFAKQRMDKLSAKDLKSAVKIILGTLNSMNGVLVNGKRPKEVIKEIGDSSI